MVMTDPIADFATRLRNASAVGQDEVRSPNSKLKAAVAEVLKESGYLTAVKTDGSDLVCTLAPNPGGLAAIRRISKPGRRVYGGRRELPRVRQGLGVAVVSTSQGVMTADTARKRHLGGEVLLEVY
jgi:small subunit ribosomal protein S8